MIPSVGKVKEEIACVTKRRPGPPILIAPQRAVVPLRLSERLQPQISGLNVSIYLDICSKYQRANYV